MKLQFTVSIIDNGNRLDRIVDNIDPELYRRIAWVGVDIDSAVKETYNKVRAPNRPSEFFDQVKRNIRLLSDHGVIVDIKVLYMEFNTSEFEIERLFRYASEVGARKLHIRPVVLGGQCFPINDQVVEWTNHYSRITKVPFDLRVDRTLPRTYTKCHSMFNFPVFTSNGNVVLCCEMKGNLSFELCSWLKDDWRRRWMGERHLNIYEAISTNLCPPCRPNPANIAIQQYLDDPSKLEDLFF